MGWKSYGLEAMAADMKSDGRTHTMLMRGYSTTALLDSIIWTGMHQIL